MTARRPLSTEEMLGLLGAALVVLLLISARNGVAFTVLAVVVCASLIILGVAVGVLTYRDQPLDVVDGALVVALAAVLLFPTVVVLMVVSAVSVAGLASLSPALFWATVPDASRFVLQWAFPAILCFPLGLARFRRAQVALGVVFVAVLVAAVAATPPYDIGSVAATLGRFVAAALLGGPLFVAARTFPDHVESALASVR